MQQRTTKWLQNSWICYRRNLTSRGGDFFYTSDEELTYGGNWIEEIRQGMQDATLILPVITPNYLASHFCLCELGAAWVNQQALVPVIIPPLDHDALSSTPYRAWAQSIILNSTKDLLRLADSFSKRKIGTGAQMVRFTTRAEELYEETVVPFIKKMEEREIITPEMVKKLRQDYSNIQEAYRLAEDEVRALKSENELLRTMKDAEQVKEMDRSNMSEWDSFISAVSDAKEALNKLDRLTTSVLFHSYKRDTYGGFIGSDGDRHQLNVLESEGYIKWDDGWVPDYDHPHVSRAENSLFSLKEVIKTYGDIIEERFQDEFDGIRFGLNYSPFWETVLGQKIDHSQQ